MHRASGFWYVVAAFTAIVSPAFAAAQSTRAADRPVIVSNPNPELLTPLSVSPTPLLRLGSIDGEPAQQFGRVIAVRRTSSGSIAVADQAASEIRIFTLSGELASVLGGRGGGPGEFESLDAMFVRADTVYAWDGRLGRLTVFTPDGSVARTVAIRPVEALGRPTPVGVLAGGRLAIRVTQPVMAGETPTGIRRDSMRVFVTDAQGESLRSVGALPGSESFVLRRGRSTNVTDLPFARRGYAAAHDETVVLAATDGYRFHAYDLAGPRLSIRAEVPDRRVSDEQLERARQRESERLREIGFYERMAENVEEKYRAIPRGRPLPAFADMRLASDGRLWVRLAGRDPADPPIWVVHDSDGQARSAYQLPAGARLMDAGGDWVVGTLSDEFGVDYVGLWRLPG